MAEGARRGLEVDGWMDGFGPLAVSLLSSRTTYSHQNYKNVLEFERVAVEEERSKTEVVDETFCGKISNVFSAKNRYKTQLNLICCGP